MQLEGQEFDAFFCSPLQRAAVTGRIIWAGRQGTAQATLSDPLEPSAAPRTMC
jgi:broad specificity phosphatase PhoE